MNTKKKFLVALAIVGCAILLVAGTIAGTVAYLTSTATVKNTFTVGNVSITMAETATDLYGVAGSTTTNTGNSYKLIPGHTYVKDPKITVTAGSEKCYLFVNVTNDIAAYEIDESATNHDTISEQMTKLGWKQMTAGSNIWYYNNNSTGDKGFVVDAGTDKQDVKVFETFTIADGKTLPSDTKDVDITIIAYAIQADGFDTAAAAWEAASSSFTTNG